MHAQLRSNQISPKLHRHRATRPADQPTSPAVTFKARRAKQDIRKYDRNQTADSIMLSHDDVDSTTMYHQPPPTVLALSTNGGHVGHVQLPQNLGWPRVAPLPDPDGMAVSRRYTTGRLVWSRCSFKASSVSQFKLGQTEFCSVSDEDLVLIMHCVVAHLGQHLLVLQLPCFVKVV